MSFGKKPGEPGSAPVRQRLVVQQPAPTKSAGGFDARFLAMILGVVALAGGAAFAAPSMLSFGKSGVLISEAARPLDQVMAGLNREQAKKALATQAFPDKAGREFMTALATQFPDEHQKLLGVLADAAMSGSDRLELMQAAARWTIDFVRRNGDAIGRSGAQGFDAFVDLGSEALDLVKDLNDGRCDLGSLQTASFDAARLQKKLGGYDSRAYRFAMRAGVKLVDMAAAGRRAPATTATPGPQDEMAMRQVMMGMMSDPAVVQIMQTMSNNGGRIGANSHALDDLDVCGLGHRMLAQLDRLPADTKARIWTLGVQQAKMSGGSAFRNLDLGRMQGFGL